MKLKFDRTQLAAVLAAVPADKPLAEFLLVKDDGIYIMSSAEARPAHIPASEKFWKHTVAYAKGYNPKTDGDVWEKCREAVGGDDFGEVVGKRCEFESILADSDGDIIVSVTASNISVSYLPKRTPEQVAARAAFLKDWLIKAKALPARTPKTNNLIKKATNELAALGGR